VMLQGIDRALHRTVRLGQGHKFRPLPKTFSILAYASMSPAE
jgi:hypothetical protein